MISGAGRAFPCPSSTARAGSSPSCRTQLAEASVETLQPDLVILDEFQRFRHLLDLECGGEAAELAHLLFNYPAARVLLLSATPYKPFTLAEEERGGEDHFTDFVRTLDFLAQGSPLHLEQVRDDLAEYRSALIAAADASEPAKRLRDQLLLVMARTERPQLGKDGMLQERSLDACPVHLADLTGFAALRRVAESVNGNATVEYWKSVPYFINFMEGYQLAERVQESLKTAAGRAKLEPLLQQTQRLDRAALEHFRPIDLGNGRLRALAADTVGNGWWRLLWLPPSMPYLTPAGAYADVAVQGMTKRLIFSSWSAAPTAIASLLSYEAERKLVADSRLTSNTPTARAAIATRLDYTLRGEQPARMSALALFWPHPELADLADPIQLARTRPNRTITAGTAAREVVRRLSPLLPRASVGPAGDGAHWRAVLGWPGALPALLIEPIQIAEALAGEEAPGSDRHEAAERSRGLDAHVRLAVETVGGPPQPAADDRNELLKVLAVIAAHSPGNIAYRSLKRVLGPGHTVTDIGLWEAAATLAAGLRSLFNRLDSILLLDKLYGTANAYWRRVLRYCADGNLQAVLDEYLHHLRSEESTVVMDDTDLMTLARRARDAVSCAPPAMSASIPTTPASPSHSSAALPNATAANATTWRAPGSRKSATPSTVRSGRSCLPRPASARKASTSTGGATQWCTGTCPPTRWTSSNAKAASTGSEAMPCAATSRLATGPA